MPMTTALTAAAAINSSLALEESEQAHAAACQSMIQTFNNATASDASRLQFADCIQLLHPAAHGSVPIVIKILLSLVLIGAAIGAWREQYERALGAISGAILGLIVWLIGIAVALIFS